MLLRVKQTSATNVTLGNLNDLTYEDLILLINAGSAFGKVPFDLVQPAKSFEFSKGHCNLAWDRLVNKYAPHPVSSMQKLKGEFHNSMLDSIGKDSNKWMSNLEML